MKPAPKNGPREALRYLQNAKAILREIPIEGNTYADVKPVREALGTAYRAVLEAVNEHLQRKGLAKRELPKSVEGYRIALRTHLASRNGKLLREFEQLYDGLHIAGYYRGLIYNVAAVKDYLQAARTFIEKVR
jgi:hypothetical protein